MRLALALLLVCGLIVGCAKPKPDEESAAVGIDEPVVGGGETGGEDATDEESGPAAPEGGETPAAFVGEYVLDKEAWIEAMGEILKEEGITDESLPEMLDMMREGEEFQAMRMELTLNADGTFEGVGNFDGSEEQIKGVVEPTATGVRLILTERNGGEPGASDEPLSFTRLPDGTLVQTDLQIEQPALVLRKQ